MTAQGLQPQAPTDLRSQLVAAVSVSNPDFTDNLPGSLVEDITSTDVAACLQSDSFLVDLVNSISPNGANPFLLQQLGILYGLQPQAATNTSVYVVFNGPPGFVIVQGFTVSDASYQYVVQDGGIIGADGASLPLYAVATVSGTWPVPSGSVTQIITSVPASVASQLLVNNPIDGIPSTALEDITDFRDRVMTAGLAASTGMSRYMKTLLAQVPGVQARLVSARQDPVTGRYIVLVGGGDPYQVGYALWRSCFWVPGFIPAPLNIENITSANPAVVTTATNHNLITGMIETISQVQGTGVMPSINEQSFPVTVIDDSNFSIPFNANIPGSTYTIGGVVTPNPIVETVTIVDYPDTYVIPYTLPQQDTVNITVTWQTDSPNYVSPSAIASAAGPALVAYINSLPVGTTPINFYDMTAIFLDAVSGIVPAEAITVLNFAVGIVDNANGIVVPVAPAAGTGVVYGDENSYFYTTLADVVFSESGF